MLLCCCDTVTQGDPGQLTSSLPSMVELDLTCNLIYSWDVAEGLSTALPQLKASGDVGLEWEAVQPVVRMRMRGALEILFNWWRGWGGGLLLMS